MSYCIIDSSPKISNFLKRCCYFVVVWLRMILRVLFTFSSLFAYFIIYVFLSIVLDIYIYKTILKKVSLLNVSIFSWC